MPDQDCVFLREQLSRFPGSKLGFMIYRLTYKDDEEWTRFMAYFKSRTHKNLEESGDEDLIPHISWDVHEDPAMEGAPSSQVRAHFRERVESLTTNCVDRSIQDAESDDATAWEKAFMMLVSIEEEEDWTHVALSSVFPRVYSLLEGPGWDVIGREGVFNS
ncbi:uncharacterized protein N0V89_000235 [Didymosphaeria variabile]|uniref:Uncharacterized protein n=1 Tax=Didymosphaeria variabile TaxID=1932322 RepID=A0A9W8XTW9_9PLEO|nr:uncharacterized protein N0V89_000235 [Didymosphaeria variabile]KAJ4359679.1 hypothetical protein N0V89_000235 [Didymosphaeria variabile]